MNPLLDDPAALERAFAAVAGYRREVDTLPVEHPLEASTIRAQLEERYGFRSPLSLSSIVEDVAALLRDGQIQTSSRRYLGLFCPQALPSSIAADAMVAGFNPQLAAWSHASAANEIEQHTLRTFLALVGFDPALSHGTFTTGGGEANLSAVVVALTHAFPDYGNAGLRGLSGQPVLYLSEHAHHSLMKAAHAAGLGRSAVRIVPTDGQMRIDPEALALQIRNDRAAGFLPFMVAATAGATATGSIDALEPIAEVCRAESLWLHVDAAWGGSALLSSSLRMHLKGIEQADSVTWDAHKWLSVAMGAGMFLCRHPDSVAQAFRVSAHYMPRATDSGADPYMHSIQWSRRFIGLKVFMALASIGLDGYARMVDEQTALGNLLRVLLTEQGWVVHNSTPLPLVCFSHPRLNGVPDGAQRIVEALKARQPAWWLSEVRLSGHEPLIRACITNYRTSAEDIRELVDALNEVL